MERRSLEHSLLTLTSSAPPRRSLWHALIGLAALESAVAAVVLIAANPPPSAPRIEIALGPSSLPPAIDPRTIPGVPNDLRRYVLVEMGPPDLPDLGLAPEPHRQALPPPSERFLARLDRPLREPPTAIFRQPDAILAPPGMAAVTEPKDQPVSPAEGLSTPTLPPAGEMRLAQRPSPAETWPRGGPGLPDDVAVAILPAPDLIPPAPAALLADSTIMPVDKVEALEPRPAPVGEPPMAPQTAQAEGLVRSNIRLLAEPPSDLVAREERLAPARSLAPEIALVLAPQPEGLTPRRSATGEIPLALAAVQVSERLVAGSKTALADLKTPNWRRFETLARTTGPMMVPEQSRPPRDMPQDSPPAPVILVMETSYPRAIPRPESPPIAPKLALAEVRPQKAPRGGEGPITPPPVTLAWIGEAPLRRSTTPSERIENRQDVFARLADTPLPRLRLDALPKVASLTLAESPVSSPRVEDVDISAFRALRMFDVAPDTTGGAAVSDRPVALVPHGAAKDVARFVTILRDLDYNGGSMLSVPGFFLRKLPVDFDREEGERKKKLFMRAILPHILHANERVLYLRRRIIDLAPKVDAAQLASDEREFVEATIAEMGMEKWDFLELMRRLDIVPPSLALAQAAEESGWGTSDMAVSGNALFGQVHWVKASGSTVRQQRPFDDLHEGVSAYMKNLNTHRAYAKFRERRAQLRTKGQRPNGLTLISELEKYSERGDAYIRTIRGLIVSNNLLTYDDARFRIGTSLE
jgi:Bax protein